MDRRGILFGLAAALLFGLSTPVLKVFLDQVDPFLAAGMLYLGAGFGCGLVVLAAEFSRHRQGLSGSVSGLGTAWPWLAGAVLAGGVVAPVLFLTGLKRTDAAFTSLLLNLESVATVFLAWALFREHIGRRASGGMAAILAGAVALSWAGAPGASGGSGPLLVLLACLCWGIDNNLTRKVSLASPFYVTMVKGLVAGTINLLLARSEGANWPGMGVSGLLGLVGFVCYGLSLSFFVLALRHLGAARTGAYFATAPFLGATLSLAAGQGQLSLQLLAGGLLMGGGVWLSLTERHAHPHGHPISRHEHAHIHDEHHAHPHPEGIPTGEPHTHPHRHNHLVHDHPHFPDLHHDHPHS